MGAQLFRGLCGLLLVNYCALIGCISYVKLGYFILSYLGGEYIFYFKCSFVLSLHPFRLNASKSGVLN